MAEALRQGWPLPSAPRPIVVIGAGSIVRDAHLPVYRRLGFPVAGLFDVRREAAEALAGEFGVPCVFGSLAEAAATPGAVFDLAVPPQAILPGRWRRCRRALVCSSRSRSAWISPEAARIAALCRERRLVAAVNFQLRFSPNMLALADAIRRGWLGEVTDVEVRVVVHTPWEYWAFLAGAPRLEVLMHSIHYIDLVRSLLGEPEGVYCKGLPHPSTPGYADARTTAILDYPGVRCSIVANHAHRLGRVSRNRRSRSRARAGRRSRRWA